MRYFIELAYVGDRYSGFQVQENANTVQAEVQKALQTIFKTSFELTGSSRTDAGVHARQNFFHFDTELTIQPRIAYNLNALLPDDISVTSLRQVANDAHSRFDATSRLYQYFIYADKDPFLLNRAYYFPYKLNLSLLSAAAAVLMEYKDFTSFSKRNTQTHTKLCTILQSEWKQQGNLLIYTVEANRFLRGMVKGLVGTMLRVGRGKTTLQDFRKTIEGKDCSLADFSVAAHGLYLTEVKFREPATDNCK
jgi:tRNA pseudouridine38-40 synthase